MRDKINQARQFLLLDRKTVGIALRSFSRLKIKDKEDQGIKGERFFRTYAPGNTIPVVNQPFERFNDYQLLLAALRNKDSAKYDKIHKGTPFYFLAWTAFDLRNYENALFYVDAAMSEDIRYDPNTWIALPAAQFLTLGEPDDQVAARVVRRIKGALQREITRFNSLSSVAPIALDSLVRYFVLFLASDKPKRTIITSLYTFILEFEDRFEDLTLRSSEGGSVEPFLTHMFKGALIFESLLKNLYPAKDSGGPTETLGNVFHKVAQFQADFTLHNLTTSAKSLRDILSSASSNDLEAAFNTAAKLRNTTGHNLVWDDIFSNLDNYRLLFEQQVNALFYIIEKKYLRGRAP
jgi:hypothetical protein